MLEDLGTNETAKLSTIKSSVKSKLKETKIEITAGIDGNRLIENIAHDSTESERNPDAFEISEVNAITNTPGCSIFAVN